MDGEEHANSVRKYMAFETVMSKQFNTILTSVDAADVHCDLSGFSHDGKDTCECAFWDADLGICRLGEIKTLLSVPLKNLRGEKPI